MSTYILVSAVENVFFLDVLNRDAHFEQLIVCQLDR